jgi:hypothetical protein
MDVFVISNDSEKSLTGEGARCLSGVRHDKFAGETVGMGVDGLPSTAAANRLAPTTRPFPDVMALLNGEMPTFEKLASLAAGETVGMGVDELPSTASANRLASTE